MSNPGKFNPNKGQWTGELGSSEFPLEKDRYHLYAAWFCPFAHRVLLTREMKQLQPFLTLDIVRAYPKGDEGWRFPQTPDEYPGSTPDRLYHSHFLNEIYRKDRPDYNGPFSVPVLWDKKAERIVNNESEEIMRQLNTAFNPYVSGDDNDPQHRLQLLNFYPEALRPQIDAINAWLVPELNLGVYKTGFAGDQETYDTNVEIVFGALQKASDALSAHPAQPFLLGKHLTEVDLKLYATLIRFDAIYVQHFKCNLGTIRHDYPVLNRYLKFLYWKNKGFKETTDFTHIKVSYTKSHPGINPKGIVPKGPRPIIEEWTAEDEKWLKGLEEGYDRV